MNQEPGKKNLKNTLANSKVKIAYEDGEKVSTKHVKLKEITPTLLIYTENTEKEAMPLKRVIRIRKKETGGLSNGDRKK